MTTERTPVVAGTFTQANQKGRLATDGSSQGDAARVQGTRTASKTCVTALIFVTSVCVARAYLMRAISATIH